jgi:hypothetical protein
MAEPKKEKKPLMAEKIKSNPEQSYRRARRAKQLPDRFTEQDLRVIAAATPGMGIGAEATDPYLSRNEFKEGFYDQPKPPVSYETLKGTAAKPIPNVTDTESFAQGGSVRGQKNIQVKKKAFRGTF